MRVGERTFPAEAAGRKEPPEGDEVGQFQGAGPRGPGTERRRLSTKELMLLNCGVGEDS